MKEVYRKCWKCGSVTKLQSTSPTMCVSPVTYRTSGICGGSFDIEITKEEYNTIVEGFKKNKE
jgi:hypothetical protein